MQSVEAAGTALGLQPMELLHAGPPLRDPCSPPPVLMSSAVVTSLHEGWAIDAEQAEAMVRAGKITFAPAQASGCVVPLAFVVSASTPLFVVGDDRGLRMHAPVSTVRGSDTRMGYRDAGLAARLLLRDQRIAPAWNDTLAHHGPLPLLPLAARGLKEGDDLHSRTAAANAALSAWLREQSRGELADDIEATPLFFLTLWMAACALMLRAVESGDQPSLVTRAGGNGERFAIALAGTPERWTCVDAIAPAGRILGNVAGDAVLCGAIGDSAVIDMLGCGGMALAGATEPIQAFAGFLPEGYETFPSHLLCGHHPGLERLVALDAKRVVEHEKAPLVALAMLTADGHGGFAGRGLYRPPVSLFMKALESAQKGSENHLV